MNISCENMTSSETKIVYEVLELQDKRNSKIDCQESLNFDLDEGTIEGTYRDELALARSKKIWGQTLQAFFDLRPNEDYCLSKSNLKLKLTFKSASGRYSFWRIVSGQIPDVQFLIETAHIPDPSSTNADTKTRIIDMKSELPLLPITRGDKRVLWIVNQSSNRILNVGISLWGKIKLIISTKLGLN